MGYCTAGEDLKKGDMVYYENGVVKKAEQSQNTEMKKFVDEFMKAVENATKDFIIKCDNCYFNHRR